MFPAVDPIPLPAPVWLFKALHLLTTALHFTAVHLLLGGLLLTTIWSFFSRGGKNQPMQDTGGVIATRLPIVMTYVINLGVPPLLFVQVLYGRAIYTSSILIGIPWISVIFILMAGYSLLYRMSYTAKAHQSFWFYGLPALLCFGSVGWIYTINMTLMLNPESWSQLYHASPLGLHLPSSDPAAFPRFCYMVITSLSLSGCALLLLATKQTLKAETQLFLFQKGRYLLGGFALLQCPVGIWIYHTQDPRVQAAFPGNMLTTGCLWIWWFMTLGMILSGLMLLKRKSISAKGAWSLTLLPLIQVSCMTVLRDAFRDLKLLQHGMDVWERTVFTNTGVLTLFFISFVIALIAVGIMVAVQWKAKPVEECYV